MGAIAMLTYVIFRWGFKKFRDTDNDLFFVDPVLPVVLYLRISAFF